MPSSVKILIYFLSKVSTIKGEDGKPKYVELVKLMLAICTLSHGKADPERGFSTNEYLLAVHGESTSEKTIQAVHFVKDFINFNSGEKNIKLSKPMLAEC